MAHPFSAAGTPLRRGPGRARPDPRGASCSCVRIGFPHFSEFIVEETLRGDGDALKEHVIAIDCTARGPTSTRRRIPSSERVDTRRLRPRVLCSAPRAPLSSPCPRAATPRSSNPAKCRRSQSHSAPSAPQIGAIPAGPACRRSTIALALDCRGGDCRRANRRIGDVVGARRCPAVPLPACSR